MAVAACTPIDRDYAPLGADTTQLGGSASPSTSGVASGTSNASATTAPSAVTGNKDDAGVSADDDDPDGGVGDASVRDASLPAPTSDTGALETPDAAAVKADASETPPSTPVPEATTAPIPVASTALGEATASAPTAPATSAAPEPPVIIPSLLVFSKTVGFRHSSVVPGNQALQALALAKGWEFDTTEDAQVFNDNGLSDANVIVFLNTSGEVLDDTQQAAMERFIQAGHGFVGVHHAAAPDTEPDWAWYDGLIGARFGQHGLPQDATVVVEDTSHPSTSHLSSTWLRNDEWNSLDRDPRSQVHVLLSMDASSYTPVGPLITDQPISWYHDYDGGRAFFTGMGHTDASYAEEDFIEHLAGAIEWASGAAAAP
jgi:cytochrome c